MTLFSTPAFGLVLETVADLPAVEALGLTAQFQPFGRPLDLSCEFFLSVGRLPIPGCCAFGGIIRESVGQSPIDGFQRPNTKRNELFRREIVSDCIGVDVGPNRRSQSENILPMFAM